MIECCRGALSPSPSYPARGWGVCCSGGVIGGGGFTGSFKRPVFVHLSFLPWLLCVPQFKV